MYTEDISKQQPSWSCYLSTKQFDQHRWPAGTTYTVIVATTRQLGDL